ncbi:MAG: hypothetical protein MI864_09870, partial [Pseudomonadales bacterium]|nr:hypothetical protein [Pseudomonadales bacterium]
MANKQIPADRIDPEVKRSYRAAQFVEVRPSPARTGDTEWLKPVSTILKSISTETALTARNIHKTARFATSKTRCNDQEEQTEHQEWLFVAQLDPLDTKDHGWIKLESADFHCYVSIDHCSWEQVCPRLSWWEYQEDAWPLAWSLEYETWLTAFEQLTHTAWRATRVVQPHTELNDSQILYLTWRCSNEREKANHGHADHEQIQASKTTAEIDGYARDGNKGIDNLAEVEDAFRIKDPVPLTNGKTTPPENTTELESASLTPHKSSKAKIATGCIALPIQNGSENFIQKIDWSITEHTNDIASRFRDTTFNCPFSMQPVEDFSAEELEAFQPGDIMLLGNLSACANSMTLVTPLPDLKWHAQYRNSKLAIMKSKTVQSGRSRIQSFRVKGVSRFGKQNHKLYGKPQGDLQGKKQEGNTMNSETTERQSKETSNNILKQMPVNLSFQLGELTLTLEQLQDIQPGYVFELAERLDQ